MRRRSQTAAAVLLSMFAATGARAAVVISKQRTQNMTCSAGTCVPTAANAYASVTGSYALGSVEVGNAGNAGGLAGVTSGSVSGTFAYGSVTGSGGYVQAGGVGADAGGLVGYNNAVVIAAYSTGAPGGGQQSYEGGLIGYADVSSSVSDGYWDVSTSGIANLAQGAGNISYDSGITGQTTSQLQSGLPAGFDPSIWTETANIDSGLPCLIDNPPPS
jgi:hypothetical protein